MLHFITGGQRSGKSAYAQQLALQLSDRPVYLATAKIWDDEFSERVKRHQQDRSEIWTNIEEERYISRHQLKDRVIVLDCITLWLTNFFKSEQQDMDLLLEEVKAEFNKFMSMPKTVLAISNEIGMGLHADTQVGRKFTDLQGWVNQYIAKKADKVTFMVSGIPLVIKDTFK